MEASQPIVAVNRVQHRRLSKKAVPHRYYLGQPIDLGIKEFKRSGNDNKSIRTYKAHVWAAYIKTIKQNLDNVSQPNSQAT